jgi:hypothetical protein
VSELLPAGPSPVLARRSAFDDFLDRAVIHERMGGLVSPFLLKSALLADLGLLLLVLVGSLFNPSGVGRSSFFILGGGIVAALIHLLQWFTWPLLVVAVTGLALNAWSRGRRTHEAVHVLCAVQTVPALTLSFGWVLVFALFAIELLIWIVMAVLAIVLMVALVAGLIAAAGS